MKTVIYKGILYQMSGRYLADTERGNMPAVDLTNEHGTITINPNDYKEGIIIEIPETTEETIELLKMLVDYKLQLGNRLSLSEARKIKQREKYETK